MITWVTVWVLTVNTSPLSNSNTVYQLQYASQKTCLEQAKKHMNTNRSTSDHARCDFQQIPMVTK